MRAYLLVPVVLLSVLSVGCVSKSDHEALQAQLDACQQEKAQVEAEVISWEQRFDRESSRWTQIGDSVAEAVPQALTEMHEERTRILNMVPEQVQNEVSDYLDEYFNTVMSGFDRMAQDNRDLRVEVMGMQKAMEVLGHDTKAIGKAIDDSLTDEKGRRQKLARDLADIIDLVVEYDQTRLNCKGCPDRLKMRDKSRSALLAFHQDLMSDLSRLQAYAAAAPTETEIDEETPTDDTAAVETSADEGSSGD